MLNFALDFYLAAHGIGNLLYNIAHADLLPYIAHGNLLPYVAHGNLLPLPQ